MARIGFHHLASAIAAFGVLTAWLGCSAAPECDPAKCAAGNKCLPGFPTADAEQKGTGSTTSCKLPCAKQDDCPFNYHCTGAAQSYCVPDRPPGGKAYAKKATGQWGTSCDPTKGIEANPSCDSAQNFWCYASSPSDGAAFCTQFQCTDDGDCRGGYWCARLNTAPNATTAGRSFGEATTVCLPRAWNGNVNSYCAPCKTDLDCPLNGGLAQYCVAIGDGSESVCGTRCGTSSNCNRDATCVDSGQVDSDSKAINVCVPRANTCKGTGEFCQPCHSDKDCKDGFCIGPSDGDPAPTGYSTERFCSKKSATACVSSNTSPLVLSQSCPAAPSGTSGCVASTVANKPATTPLADQCIGFWTFNTANVPGCWSAK